ncbi:MAG: hypothetical protein HDQ88_07385 [Clostridia bacterium]|nr:hypothetical protein [Clostridia bacterium]
MAASVVWVENEPERGRRREIQAYTAFVGVLCCFGGMANLAPRYTPMRMRGRFDRGKCLRAFERLLNGSGFDRLSEGQNEVVGVVKIVYVSFSK